MTLSHGKDIKNAEQLRNVNSFEYLREIARLVTPDLADLHPFLFKLKTDFFDGNNNEIKFKENFPYGDLYTKFLKEFQDRIGRIEGEQIARYIFLTNEINNKVNVGYKKIHILEDMDKIIFHIYANNNNALKRSAEFAMSALQEKNIQAVSHEAENAIFDKSKGHEKGENLTTSFIKESSYVFSMFAKNKGTSIEQQHPVTRFKSTFIDSNYQPTFLSNIASVRYYNHHKDKKNFRTEYRFSTQAEVVDNMGRVNPLFISWVAATKRMETVNDINKGIVSQNKINHIYFNNLGLDRTGMEGEREREMSLKLHDLEKNHSNVVVITLPADKGLMSHDMLKKSSDPIKKQRNINLKDHKNKILDIVTAGSDIANPGKESDAKDFYISDNVKVLLYGEPRDSSEKYNQANERKIMEDLLNKSLDKLGVDVSRLLTKAEAQAVYFHFIKYEVTDFIIQKLDPDSINFACKDAIDRGGVSSLYYNLIKSIETDQPMSQDEFLEALHAAPTLVKGRGINDHLDRVWNGISTYVEANKKNKEHPVPDWLITMHNYHRNNFIKKIIEDYHYSSIIGSKINISDNDYFDYTSGINHKKLDDVQLSAVKARISDELIESLELLSHNPDNLNQLELIHNVDHLVDEALRKSSNARYQGLKIKTGDDKYHSAGTLEEELKAIFKVTTYMERITKEKNLKVSEKTITSSRHI